MHEDISITSQGRMHRLVQEWGFLPFFSNQVRGFSIEEHTPQELWFSDQQMASPWEWKGPVITEWDCTYGKFFRGKAGFVSLTWLPDFMNWRRSLHPTLSDEERHILTVLQEHESLLSRELKKACGYTLARKRQYDRHGIEDREATRHNGATFDRIIAELQMSTHVVIADFEYQVSRQGERYGWGLARYCTPEALFGPDLLQACDHRTPQESRQRIIQHLLTLFPDTTVDTLQRIV